MKKILMLSAAVLMFQAMPVLAQDDMPPPPHEGPMGEPRDIPGDTNGDGVISQDEFMARANERFSDIDANNDGSISRDEAKAAHEKRRGEMRDRMKDHKDKMKDRWEHRKDRHGDDSDE